MNKSKVIVLILIFSLGVITGCSKFYSPGCGSADQLSTGEYTITSNDIERVYYLKMPENYDPGVPYPLIFAFHGMGMDYTSYSEEIFYKLQSAVGNEAILVYPNALLAANGMSKWGDEDLTFFDDLYEELAATLCFDKRKVFAVGHSDGAGFTHMLGCKRGNKLRAISPLAGSLMDRLECIGQVAVIQIHGENDTIVPLQWIRPSRDYWVAINSCNKEETQEGVDQSCEAYSACDADFPVEYCEHSGGHWWPDFAGAAVWNFFKSLPPAEPSDEIGTGDLGDLAQGTINFKILYPSDFVGRPEKLMLSLRPPNTTPPFSDAILYILNFYIAPGDYQFGEVTEYNNVEIYFQDVPYGDYTLSLTVYVEGSNYPIRTNGKDYQSNQKITIDGRTTITVETPFELELA